MSSGIPVQFRAISNLKKDIFTKIARRIARIFVFPTFPANKKPAVADFSFPYFSHLTKLLRSPGVEPGFREPESHVRSITLTAQVPNYITQYALALQVFSGKQKRVATIWQRAFLFTAYFCVFLLTKISSIKP